SLVCSRRARASRMGVWLTLSSSPSVAMLSVSPGARLPEILRRAQARGERGSIGGNAPEEARARPKPGSKVARGRGREPPARELVRAAGVRRFTHWTKRVGSSKIRGDVGDDRGRPDPAAVEGPA